MSCWVFVWRRSPWSTISHILDGITSSHNACRLYLSGTQKCFMYHWRGHAIQAFFRKPMKAPNSKRRILWLCWRSRCQNWLLKGRRLSQLMMTMMTGMMIMSKMTTVLGSVFVCSHGFIIGTFTLIWSIHWSELFFCVNPGVIRVLSKHVWFC